MPIKQITSLVGSRTFLPGLLFFAINLSASTILYQNNSYKIALLLLAVTLLFLREDILRRAERVDHPPWKMGLLLSLPVLATLPGYFISGGSYNYNFDYELATFLVLLLWSGYIYRMASEPDALQPLFIMIAVTLIYLGVWAILEKTGYHPLGGGVPVFKVEATFGNPNYFSGFLIVVLPLMLALSLPEIKATSEASGLQRWHFSYLKLFFLIAFCFGEVSLLLAETRSAIAAHLLSLFVFAYLFTVLIAAEVWKRRLFVLLCCIVLGVFGIGLYMLFNAEQFPDSRFAALFTKAGWIDRLIPWEAAINAISASPMLGYGLGSSYNLFFQFVDPDAGLYASLQSYNHAHSELLEILQEGGVAGALAWLLFWSVIAVMLVRIARSSVATQPVQRLAVGIGAGFVAFHSHGLFSVAERMISVKLPLYTLIAVTFALYIWAQQPARPLPAILSKRVLHTVASLLLLGVVYLIFTPWAYGQYAFRDVLKNHPQQKQRVVLEPVLEDYPDIYGLDYLLQLQLKEGGKGMAHTMALMEQRFPGYQDLGYYQALHAGLAGDPKEAQRLALAYQARNRYHQPSMQLLTTLAVATNDAQGFFQQLQLLTRKQLFAAQLRLFTPAEAVQIEQRPMQAAIEIQEQGQTDGLTIVWNSTFVGQLLNKGREVMRKKQWRPQERERVRQYLLKQILAAPYFAPIKQEGKEGGGRLDAALMKRHDFADRMAEQLSSLIFSEGKKAPR